MGDRGPHPDRTRRRRVADGPLAAPSTARDDRSPGQGQSVHELVVRAPTPPGRAARVDGLGRLEPGQRGDGVFWSSMQRELLDRRSWPSKQVLATAMFEWIEGWSNPRRRHCGIGMLSPHEFETLHAPAATAA